MRSSLAMFECYRGSVVFGGLGVMADDLGHDEREPLLRELGVEVGIDGERTQARELLLLTSGVGCRHPVLRLQLADLLGRTEPLGEQIDQRRVDVVDAAAQTAQRRVGSSESVIGPPRLRRYRPRREYLR